MNATKLVRKVFLHTAAVVFLIVLAANASAQDQAQDEVVQLGQEVFNELKAKGEIIESSPL